MKQFLLFISVFLTVSITAFSQCSMIVNHNNPTCYGSGNGWAEITPNGVPPFTFQWSNNLTGQIEYGLYDGFYSITMTDSVGCTAIDTFTLVSPQSLYIFTDSVKNVTCFGENNGEAWIHGVGGTPPYTFDWGAGQNVTHMTGLSYGYHYPYITDSKGCYSSGNIDIMSPAAIGISENIYDTYCLNTTGSIQVMPYGGTPFYSSTNMYYNYQWNNSVTTAYNGMLAPGIYKVTVTDSLGCNATKDYVMNDYFFAPQIYSYQNINCHGINTGSVDSVLVNGGTPPYTYTWSNGASTNQINNLATGTYFLTVMDSSIPPTCGGYAMVTILEPDSIRDSPMTYNPYCFGDSTGYINLYISGGSPGQAGPPYNYLWNTGDTTNYLFNIPTGTYSVSVTDMYNCLFTETVNITSPPKLILDTIVITNVSCYGMNDASIAFFLSGGNPPYIYSNGGEMFDTVHVFTGLRPDSLYSFHLKDVNYCLLPIVDTTFTQPSLISLPFTENNPTCVGTDGSIIITPSGGTPPFSATWDTAPLSGLTVNGLTQGNYAATITDANGCENSLGFMLFQNSVPAALYGTTLYSGGIALPQNEAKIYLFKPTSTSAVTMDTISETINSASMWHFAGLMPGNYYVKVNLLNPTNYPNLLNSYYDNTFEWQNATPIVLSCDDTTIINLNMVTIIPQTTGNGSLSGTVIMLGGVKSTNAYGEPVPGAEIIIEQEPNDVPVQCAFTDTAGLYTFTNLVPDTGYHLIVQIPGFPIFSTYSNITVIANDTLPNFNFLVDTIVGIYKDSASYVSQISMNGISFNVYPNPFTSVVNISLQLEKTEKISFELFDVMGRKIEEVNYGLILPGKHDFTLNNKNSITGPCYIMIHAGNNLLMKKLIALPK